MPYACPGAISPESLEGLYRGELGGFIGRRNELAKSLKSRGEVEASEWVWRLAKPVVTAALVNDLYWSCSEEFQKLFLAGDGVREAQRTAAAPAAQRAAGEERQRAIRALIEQAGRLQAKRGQSLSRAAVQRVTRTLEALSIYGPGRGEGSASSERPPVGRLDQDLEPPGFEALLAMAVSLPGGGARSRRPEAWKKSAPSGETAKAADSKVASRARCAERQRARRAVAMLERELAKAKTVAKTAESERNKKERSEKSAARTVERAAERLERLKESWGEAQNAAATAVREHRKAELVLLTREKELQAAKRALSG